MVKLVQGEMNHSDWFPEWSEFAIRTVRMDRSRTDCKKLISLIMQIISLGGK